MLVHCQHQIRERLMALTNANEDDLYRIQLDDEALFLAIDSAARLGDHVRALSLIDQLHQRHPASDRVDPALVQGVDQEHRFFSGHPFPVDGECRMERDRIEMGRIDDLVETLVSEVGHHDIYITSWDEANIDRIKIMRERAEYTASKGIKLWVTTHSGRHFDLAGYCIDYANHGGWPKRENVATWHALGAKVASYAGPHTGPENPDVFRSFVQHAWHEYVTQAFDESKPDHVIKGERQYLDFDTDEDLSRTSG